MCTINQSLLDSKTNKTPNLLENMAMGAIAGAAGALIGTPAEVALIRMTADGRLPPAERRNYSGVFNALARMTSEEGKRDSNEIRLQAFMFCGCTQAS